MSQRCSQRTIKPQDYRLLFSCFALIILCLFVLMVKKRLLYPQILEARKGIKKKIFSLARRCILFKRRLSFRFPLLSHWIQLSYMATMCSKLGIKISIRLPWLYKKGRRGGRWIRMSVEWVTLQYLLPMLVYKVFNRNFLIKKQSKKCYKGNLEV